MSTRAPSLLAFALVLVACGDPDPGLSVPADQQWLVGSWFYWDASDSYGVSSDIVYRFDADGSYEREATTCSVSGCNVNLTNTGTWTVDATNLVLAGSPTAHHVTPNCRLIELDGKTFTGTPDPSLCPFESAPLTPFEWCLVGAFERCSNGGCGDLVLAEDRYHASSWTYTSGADSGDRLGYWYVRDGQLHVDTHPNAEPIPPRTVAVYPADGAIVLDDVAWFTDGFDPRCDPSG